MVTDSNTAMSGTHQAFEIEPLVHEVSPSSLPVELKPTLPVDFLGDVLPKCAEESNRYDDFFVKYDSCKKLTYQQYESWVDSARRSEIFPIRRESNTNQIGAWNLLFRRTIGAKQMHREY